MRIEDKRFWVAQFKEKDLSVFESYRDNVSPSRVTSKHSRLSSNVTNLNRLETFGFQIHNLEFTAGLDEEKYVWVNGAPLRVHHMRIQPRFELHFFWLYVPDHKNFVICGLCNNRGICWTPADRSYVLVRKSEQFNQLESMLVVDVNRKRRGEGELVFAACKHLLLPYLHARNCNFLCNQIRYVIKLRAWPSYLLFAWSFLLSRVKKPEAILFSAFLNLDYKQYF